MRVPESIRNTRGFNKARKIKHTMVDAKGKYSDKVKTNVKEILRKKRHLSDDEKQRIIDLIHQDNPNFVMPKEENDPSVYKMLANKDVVGVFQLESSGMSNVIQNLRTSNLNDIISALALYRPGRHP